MFQPVSTFDIKQGNSFSFVASYTDEQGQPLPIGNTQITAHIKNAKKAKLATMDVRLIDESTFELKLPVGVNLPPMTLYMDIQFSQNGTVRNSDIIELNIVEVVTSG